MLFLPNVAIVSHYFSTKKAFAFEIAGSGSSLGGYTNEIWLHDELFLDCGIQVVCFIQEYSGHCSFVSALDGSLGLLRLDCSLLSQSLDLKLRGKSSTTRREYLDLTALKAKPYLAFSVSSFLGFMGIYVIFFYIQLYGEKLIPNFFAYKIQPLNIIIPFLPLVTHLRLVQISVKLSEAETVVFCLLYGFFRGAFVSLPGIIVKTILPNLEIIGIQLGLTLSISGFGMPIGEPIAGVTLDVNSGWNRLQAFCRVMIFSSVAFALLAQIYRTGPILMTKA